MVLQKNFLLFKLSKFFHFSEIILKSFKILPNQINHQKMIQKFLSILLILLFLGTSWSQEEESQFSYPHSSKRIIRSLDSILEQLSILFNSI